MTTKIKRKIDLTKKARKKYFSGGIALNLIRYNPDSLLKKSYWNTFYCSASLYKKAENDFRTKYCKNRWCPTCQSIRVAKLIIEYKEALNNLTDTYFITLTKPTVFAEDLPERIKYMNTEWRKISELARKQKKQLKGVRKSECTLTKGKYHFHYHIICEGEENTKWIYDQWMKRNPDSSKKAQEVKKCDEFKLIELFKYVTKLSFSTSQKNKKGEVRAVKPAHLFKALDTIFTAMKGKRVYNAFGISKTINENNIGDDDIKEIIDKEKNLYTWYVHDWINDLGELLSGYTPPDKIVDYFDMGKNTDMNDKFLFELFDKE